MGGELEQTRLKVAKLEKIVADYEEIVQEEKSKLWFKFTSYFKKQEIGDEKILGIARDKLEQFKSDLQEKENTLGELKEVILDSSAMEDSRKMLKDFYAEQSEIKDSFESEKEVRSIENISRERGVMFVHSIPLDNADMHNTSENNEIIDAKKVDVTAKIKMILGLQPTISTSTINEASHRKGMMYPFGLLMNGGCVVSANKGDAFTKTIGMYARMPKYDNNFKECIIQKDISVNVDDAINNASIGGRDGGMSDQGYNEIVVENPKASILYIDLENRSQKMMNISQVKEISEQLNLPVVGLKDGKVYDLIHGGKELSHEEVLALGGDLSTDEKLAMAESSLDDLFPKHEEKGVPKEVVSKMEEMRKNAKQDIQKKNKSRKIQKH